MIIKPVAAEQGKKGGLIGAAVSGGSGVATSRDRQDGSIRPTGLLQAIFFELIVQEAGGQGLVLVGMGRGCKELQAG